MGRGMHTVDVQLEQGAQCGEAKPRAEHNNVELYVGAAVEFVGKNVSRVVARKSGIRKPSNLQRHDECEDVTWKLTGVSRWGGSSTAVVMVVMVVMGFLCVEVGWQ